MLLHRIDIKGFKSFADRTFIQFDEGITGIVGPNGCGKSNIVDAMRWVLGEQRTRNLRSDKMHNIIFNGTSKRKAAGGVEVSLSFENNRGLLPPEYTQVTITRRYTRSGQSEYMLNGEACRRKDITDLLLNTGITSNSYAIIELKMVDDILNDTENARRSMFEEAAGIAKFKVRKKETLKKLTATLEDLERVEDLLFEIEKNMRSLERQAKQAQKYYDAKDLYEKLSLALAKKHLRKLGEDFAAQAEKLSEVQEKRRQLSEEIENSDSKLDELRKSSQSHEETLNDKRQEMAGMLHEIRQLESDQRIRAEKLRFLEEKQDNLNWQIEQGQESKEKLAVTVNGLNQQLESLQKRLAEQEAVLEEIDARRQKFKAKAEIVNEEAEAILGQQAQKQSELQTLRQEIEIKQIKIQDSHEEIQNTEGQVAEEESRLRQQRESLYRATEELERYEKTLREFQELEQHIKAQLQEAEQHRENLRESRRQITRRQDALKSELKLNQALEASMEGFSKASKFLRKNSDWPTDAPLLSELIRCKDEHRQAVETYLEPWLEHFVVQSEKEAQSAFALLAKKQKGRAKFFVLDWLKALMPPKKAQNGLRTKVQAEDAKYAPLLDWLINPVELVVNPTEAPKAQAFVTHDGSACRRMGEFLGGEATPKEGSKIGRQQKIEELQAKIQGLEGEVQEQLEAEEALKAHFEELQEQLPGAKLRETSQKLREAEALKVGAQARLEQAEQNLARVETRKKELRERIALLEGDLQNLRPRIADLQEHLGSVQEKAEALKAQRQESEAAVREISEEYNARNMELIRQRGQEDNLRTEAEMHQKNLANLQNTLQQNETDLKTAREEVYRLQEERTEAEVKLKGFQERRQVEQEKVQILERDYHEVRAKIQDFEQGMKDVLKAREAMDAQIQTLQGQLGELNVKLTSIRERISAEFEIELDDSQMEEIQEEEAMPDEELKAEIQSAKERIQKIGTINATAMDAFQEVKERHTFIVEQKNDLLEAQEALENTIAEIDKVARETFMNSFEKIRANFKEVFRTLFSVDDDCDLWLSNPEEPLESKIEIMAKPKGKRPLSIRQLSGGEKTLTATSLLFAIYLLRPAPFCVFDEVDAPLDDTNIDKFNRIIKRFASDVQFIIVTHNKRTMANTDVIYGVTMLEQGVSQVLPVSLKELEIQV